MEDLGGRWFSMAGWSFVGFNVGLRNCMDLTICIVTDQSIASVLINRLHST
jgi:hypothetical protein